MLRSALEARERQGHPEVLIGVDRRVVLQLWYILPGRVAAGNGGGGGGNDD